MAVPPWVPKEGVSTEQHLSDLSLYISRNLGALVSQIGTQSYLAPSGSGSVVSETAEDGLEESQVSFDDLEGHYHTGIGGTGAPITLSGDLTGNNTAAVVDGIQGFPVPAPTAGDNGDSLVYNHGTLAYVWQSLSTSSTRSRQQVDGWFRDAVPASLAAVVLARDLAAYAPVFLPVSGGDLLGLLVALDTPRTAGTATVEVYVNGVATGLTAVIDAANPSKKITTQAVGADTFAAGAEITVRLSTDAAFLPVTTDLRATVEIGTALA